MRNRNFIVIFLFSFLSIAFLSSWLPSLIEQPYAGKNYGFPFTFYYRGGVLTYDFLNLLFDIILWLITAGIVAKLFSKRKV